MALGADMVTAKQRTDEMIGLTAPEEGVEVAAPAAVPKTDPHYVPTPEENDAALAELQAMMAKL